MKILIPIPVTTKRDGALVMQSSRNFNWNWVELVTCMGVSCSLGVRWVFYVNNNLVMIVINMFNTLLFYNLDVLISFFPFDSKRIKTRFFRKSICTKRSFSPMFIYCAARLSYRMTGLYLVWNWNRWGKKNISEMQLSILDVKDQMLSGMLNNVVTIWKLC